MSERKVSKNLITEQEIEEWLVDTKGDAERKEWEEWIK